jgi:DtxR family Mn-dependent transcriptional regulator
MTKKYIWRDLPVLTHAEEDYLKVIYDLTREHSRAGTSQIAAVMEVTPASVSGMVKKMAAASPPLVEYRKHRGVSLTDAGQTAALEIIRHHRLLETYLHDLLGFAWEDVHEEAERLEHVISEQFEERIAHLLGHPTHDPHGAPIPSRELEMPTRAGQRLSTARPGQSGVICQVMDRDPQLLSFLSDQGLVPGARFLITAYSPLDENLTVRVEGRENTIIVGQKITRQIYIDTEDPGPGDRDIQE